MVPGENLEDWEAHRDAIVDDLAPLGAMEFALAEQVAVKLWRLGRVVRFEADLIANAQAEDELLRAHEMIHQRDMYWEADANRHPDAGRCGERQASGGEGGQEADRADRGPWPAPGSGRDGR